MATEYWDGLPVEEQIDLMIKARDSLQLQVRALRNECSVLAIYLFSEDEEDFKPEHKDILDKWQNNIAE